MDIGLVLFLILGAVGIGSALSVVLMRNPIASAIGLVIHFVALAGLYLTLQALFMAAIQVLVYAGAIMVLVVFVIMLLNLGAEEKLREKLATKQALGILLAMIFGSAMVYVISRGVFPADAAPQLASGGSVGQVGAALFTDYVYPFEMVSLILLAAVVGAVVLAKAKVE